jgi:hypothetical protein
MERNLEYGLHIVRENLYGAEYVICRVMTREDNAEHPLNATQPYYYHAKDLCLNGLEIRGHISDRDFDLVGFCPEYHSIYSVNTSHAGAMYRTLQRIDRRIDKEQAREHGDVLVAFAHAIGAKFCVIETEHKGTWLNESAWRFMTIAEGKNYLRTLIAQACHDVKERKAVAAQ